MRKKAVVWVMMWLLGLLFGMQSRVEASANSAPATYTLYKGQQVSFLDMPSDITTDINGILDISGNTGKAVSKGTVKLYTGQGAEQKLYATVTVKENEILSGVTFSEKEYAAQMLDNGTFAIAKSEFDGMSCRYSSADTKIANVDNNGIVTPISWGKTVIHIVVTDEYGGAYNYDVPIEILEPRFSLDKICLAKAEEVYLSYQDISGEVPSVISSKESVLSIRYSDSGGVKVRAQKTGTSILTATVRNHTFSCTIVVTNPKMKRQYGFYQKNKSFSLALSGTKSGSTVQWYSENVKIATVSSKGKVRTIKMGSTVIVCNVDGRILKFYLAVSTKTAVKAMRFGYKKLGKTHYSQGRRMSKNYFDCSSFVYRCYRAAGKYLVRKSSWAPVAADIGKYYVRKKKRIKASGKTYSWSKLRPGDLVCFGGSSAPRNGRYKRIYHIAMYIGNGKTIESSSRFDDVAIVDREPFTRKGVPVIVRPT